MLRAAISNRRDTKSRLVSDLVLGVRFPISRDDLDRIIWADIRRVYTTEEKWHRSDQKWNGSNHFCKETVNFYPFVYGTIGA